MDESLGVLRLLREASKRGLASGDEALVSWRGDRLVQLRCDDGAEPWLYVAELDDEDAARTLRPRADARLPDTLARPLASRVVERRLIAWHGLTEEQALAFAHDLEGREITALEGFLPAADR